MILYDKPVKNRGKRAFTLVELVIVIAVIAVLSAILIPTFSNVINNAKESSLKADVKAAITTYITENALETADRAQEVNAAKFFVYDDCLVTYNQGQVEILAKNISQNPNQTVTIKDTIYTVNLESLTDGNKITVSETKEGETAPKVSQFIVKNLSSANASLKVFMIRPENITQNDYITTIESFSLPTFYTNYLLRAGYEVNQSGAKTLSTTSTGSEFKIEQCVYEVGNANKFLFRPLISGVSNVDSSQIITLSNPQTTVTVYMANDRNGLSNNASLLEDYSQYVTIEDNAYQFTEAAAGKFFKFEITLSEEAYGNLKEYNSQQIEFECQVINNAYNVYDQLGLTVMNDLTSKAYEDIWKCSVTVQESGAAIITSDSDSLVLEADNKPLCQYVGNIDWVILHGDITLNADLMPAEFFWTEQTESYETAVENLKSSTKFKDDLLGTLRDGVGNGVYQYKNINSTKISSSFQKGFFSTGRVSVSGNYNGIVVPTEPSAIGRKLYSVLDKEESSRGTRDNPTPYWNVFQSQGEQITFTIKNFSGAGNGGKTDDLNQKPGIMLFNGSLKEVIVDNVNAQQFYTMLVCDTFEQTTKFTLSNSKLSNSYNNMIYMWRTKGTIINSDLSDSGGPLFIMCDGDNYNPKENDDNDGPNLTVYDNCKINAFASGSENWYSLYGAQALVAKLKGDLNSLLLGYKQKTMLFTKSGDNFVNSFSPDTSNEINGNSVSVNPNTYANIIAAIMCEPANVMKGPTEGTITVRGRYQTVSAENPNNVIESFEMNNSSMTTVKNYYSPIFQWGSNFSYVDGDRLADISNSDTASYNKLAIYISTKALSTSFNGPYFGVVLASADVPTT